MRDICGVDGFLSERVIEAFFPLRKSLSWPGSPSWSHG